jgi:hypothetical protein
MSHMYMCACVCTGTHTHTYTHTHTVLQTINQYLKWWCLYGQELYTNLLERFWSLSHNLRDVISVYVNVCACTCISMYKHTHTHTHNGAGD